MKRKWWLSVAFAALYVIGTKVACYQRNCDISKNTGAARAILRMFSRDVLRRWIEQGPASAHTTSYVAEANWKSTEAVDNHDHSRHGGPFPDRESSVTHNWEKIWRKSVQDRRAWVAFISNVVSSIVDANSIPRVNDDTSSTNLVGQTCHMLYPVLNPLYLPFMKAIKLYFTKRCSFTSLHI